MTALADLAWPVRGLPEAVQALGLRCGLVRAEANAPPAAPPAGVAVERLVELAARSAGVEAEAVSVPIADVERFLRVAAPALVAVPGDVPGFLALVGGARNRLTILGPDLRTHVVRLSDVRAAICLEHESRFAGHIDRLLSDAGVTGRQRDRARAAILRERLGTVSIEGCHLLRCLPSAEPRTQIRRARLGRHVALQLGAHTVQFALWLASWWIIGRAAFQGRTDRGWLVAWLLVLVTTIPFRLVVSWSQGVVAVGVGGLIKQRLLAGALRLEPDEIRHHGVGELLGRVIESDTVETLALRGGLSAVVAVVEVLFAGAVLACGTTPVLFVPLFAIWLGAIAAIGVWHRTARRAWTNARRDLTDALIENMIGHRTRLAQESRDEWHEGEDAALAVYVRVSRRMDRTVAVLSAAPRAWLVIGAAALAVAFLSTEATAASLAVSLGGVLLGERAIARLVSSVADLLGAAVALEQVGSVLDAAARPGDDAPRQALPAGAASSEYPVVEAHDLAFRYPNRADAVLAGCSLRIERGDRILLEGPSGAGKSTFTAVLTAMRPMDSGLLLFEGLDRQTLGAHEWRRRVAAAPQFYENHVLSETFGFNLLMGRSWPPRPADLAEAEALCRDLGLGELLDRMPAGLQQMVGETGWQLSHGERSRLFIARALLQEPEVLVLDESFAALDPDTLDRCLRRVLEFPGSLLVVAHP